MSDINCFGGEDHTIKVSNGDRVYLDLGEHIVVLQPLLHGRLTVAAISTEKLVVPVIEPSSDERSFILRFEGVNV